MTRIFTDGAEMGDVLFWDVIAGALTASTTQKRSGAYSYYLSDNSVGTKSITGLSELYMRWGWYRGNRSDGPVAYMRLLHGSNEIARIQWAYAGTNGHMVVYSGANSWQGDSVAVGGAWHLVELHYVMSDSGVIQLRLNGILDLDITGDTKPGSDTTIDTIKFEGGGWTSENYLDDLALNSTDNSNGLGDNSWCGDGHIVKLTPGGNGAHDNWTGSDANKVDNYLLVDDFPHNTDTDYVYASVSGTQDQYALSDFDGTGGKIIKRIFTEARARKTADDATTLKLGVLPSGSTDSVSAGRALSMNYARVVGDDLKTNPADSQAWEDADLDALELVLEVG